MVEKELASHKLKVQRFELGCEFKRLNGMGYMQYTGDVKVAAWRSRQLFLASVGKKLEEELSLLKTTTVKKLCTQTTAVKKLCMKTTTVKAKAMKAN
jgi:hypothetical protein